MKKFLAMAVMSLAAANAMAGVKLVVRSDYVNTPKYDDNTGAEVSGSSLFQPTVARMYLMGNVGDAVIDSGFNLRAFTPLVTAGGDLYKTMTTDSFVDHLFLAKTYGQWTFAAGKLWSNVGGFERRASWDGDTYLVSAANGGFGGKGAVTDSFGATGEITTPQNLSGVSAAYAITENHKVEVQILNQTNAQTIEGAQSATNKMQFVNVAYWGSFIDGMIKPYLNYGFGGADTVSTTTGVTTGNEQTFWAAGFRLAPMANLGVDVEYLANANKQTGGKAETNSAIVEARYNMNGWVPVLKYENSKVKDQAGDDLFDRNAFAVALEFVPKADEAFRYHIAYVNSSDDYKATGSDKVDYSTITVGFKYAGDIAK